MVYTTEVCVCVFVCVVCLNQSTSPAHAVSGPSSSWLRCLNLLWTAERGWTRTWLGEYILSMIRALNINIGSHSNTYSVYFYLVVSSSGQDSIQTFTTQTSVSRVKLCEIMSCGNAASAAEMIK